jgi:type IV secretion system protein VirD4
MRPENIYGSARFARAEEIKKAGLYKPGGVYMGEHGGRPLYSQGDAPGILFAGARSGKGRDVIMHNAVDYSGPLLSLDPKGENTAVSLHHQHTHGKRHYVINPCSLQSKNPWHVPQHKINPFDILTAVSPALIASIVLLMEMLIRLDGEGGSGAYFSGKARDWCGAITYLLVMQGKNKVTDLYKTLSGMEASAEFFKTITELMGLCNNEDVKRVAGEMIYKRDQAGQEYSGIMGTIFKNLNFLKDPGLQEVLNGEPDFSLSEICNEAKPVNISVVVPAEYLGAWSPFVRLIIGVAMLYKLRSPSSPRVLFLIDEAAQLGRFEMLEQAYTYGAGAGIRTWAIFQSIGQLVKNYGPAGAQTILECAGIRQCFGVRDLSTAQTLSSMIGTETVLWDDDIAQAKMRGEAMRLLLFENQGSGLARMQSAAHLMRAAGQKQYDRRQLLMPEEILTLPAEKQVIFVSDKNIPPVLADKCAYFDRTALAGAYLPNPYHPPFDRVAAAKRGLLGGTRRVWLPVQSVPVPDDLRSWPQFQRGFLSFAGRGRHHD